MVVGEEEGGSMGCWCSAHQYDIFSLCRSRSRTRSPHRRSRSRTRSPRRRSRSYSPRRRCTFIPPPPPSHPSHPHTHLPPPLTGHSPVLPEGGVTLIHQSEDIGNPTTRGGATLVHQSEDADDHTLDPLFQGGVCGSVDCENPLHLSLSLPPQAKVSLSLSHCKTSKLCLT